VKIRVAFLCALLLGAAAGRAGARENHYDVLSKMLGPIVNLFASETKNPNRAMSAEISLLEMTGLRPELAGATMTFAMESPDKLYLRAPLIGEEVAVCRDGQAVWASPGKQFDAAIRQIPNLPKLDPAYQLGPFQLPVPEKQLVFFPVLFQVRDAGDAEVAGEPCRVLDLALMTQLAHALKVEQWRARAWVRGDYKPAKIELAKPDWHIVIGFNKVDYLPKLPPATWRPSPEQSQDLLQLDAAHAGQLLEWVGNAAKARAPQLDSKHRKKSKRE
jgi:hypothetical protein